MAISWTKHPVMDGVIPTKDEMVKMGPDKVLEIFSINCEHDNSALVQNLTPPMRFNIYVCDFQQVGCSF